MKFLSDLGDQWRFLAKLERMEPPDPGVDDFKLIDLEGELPKQYGEPEHE